MDMGERRDKRPSLEFQRQVTKSSGDTTNIKVTA